MSRETSEPSEAQPNVYMKKKRVVTVIIWDHILTETVVPICQPGVLAIAGGLLLAGYLNHKCCRWTYLRLVQLTDFTPGYSSVWPPWYCWSEPKFIKKTAEPWGQGWRAQMPGWCFPQSCQWGGRAQVAEGVSLKSECSCVAGLAGKAMVRSLWNKDCWTGEDTWDGASLLTVSVTSFGRLWSGYFMRWLLQFVEN